MGAQSQRLIAQTLPLANAWASRERALHTVCTCYATLLRLRGEGLVTLFTDTVSHDTQSSTRSTAIDIPLFSKRSVKVIAAVLG